MNRVLRTTKFNWILLTLLIAINFLMGCKSDQNVFSTSSASGGGSGGTASSATGFNLSLVAKAGVSGLLHKFGDYSAPCTISTSTASTPSQINCLLNMTESDLYYYGFQIQASVPADMQCAYLEEVPYNFWKAEPGYGPASMYLATTNGTITTCTVEGVAGTIDATGKLCTSGEVQVDSSGSAVCQYDYTNVASVWDGFTGPNCCFGSYTLIQDVTTTTTAGATTTTTTTSSTKKGSWGGKVSSCVDSPNKNITGWPTDSSGNALIRLNSLAQTSYSSITSFPSVQSLYQSGQRPGLRAVYLTANMFDWARYQTNPSTWSMTTASVPRAFNPVTDRGPGNDRNTGNSATSFATPSFGQYRWDCRDAAGELKQSINLWVMSWNTKAAYETYASTGAYASANPYTQGTAGVNCTAVSSSVSCNNFWSFEDLFIVSGGSDPLAYQFPDEWRAYNPP